jgi:peroxiredoxin
MRATVGALLATLAVGVAHAETETRPAAKPWLGIHINEGTWGGVAVIDVIEDTPASLCGLQGGDEILAIDRTEVHGTQQLQITISARDVNDKVTVTYVRGGDVKRCSTRLAEQITDPSEILHRRLVGKPVPAFSLLRRSDGAVVDDTTARGRIVVLALFSTSCDDCATAISSLSARVADAARVDLYAVTADGEDAVDAYMQRLGLTAEVGADQGELVRRYLSDRGEPTILVVDHRGVVRFAATGAGTDDANLEGAELEVRRALKARRKAKK